MEETIDLFEHYETLPQIIQSIINSWDDNESLYSEADRLLEALRPHGYTFEYGLCGNPFNLTKISPCHIGDSAMVEDWIVKDSGYKSNHGIVLYFSEEKIPNCIETNWYAHLTLKSGESAIVNAHKLKKIY